MIITIPRMSLYLKLGKSTMDVTRVKSVCNETFKTLNNVNPVFMNEVFELEKTKRTFQN